jgi:hypothetical protein
VAIACTSITPMVYEGYIAVSRYQPPST